MPFRRSRRGRVGRGDLGIARENLVLIVQLVVQAARRTRRRIHRSGAAFDENRITIELHKDLVRVLRYRDFAHVWFVLEASLNLPDGDLGKIEGRIDLQAIFSENMRPDEHYFGIECKRLRPGDTGTFRYYVDAGVGKFADGTYSPQHPMGMLVGYLMAEAASPVPADLSRRIADRYPGAGALATWPDKSYRDADLVVGDVPRGDDLSIALLHALVRMHP